MSTSGNRIIFEGDILMKNKNKVAMGKRIATIRQHLGLTQQEFANKFSPPASKAAVSRWESGDRKPSNETLKQIAEMGKVSVSYILTGYSLTFAETQTLLNKAIHGLYLTDDEQNKVKESQLDFIITGAKIANRWNQQIESIMKTQSSIIEKNPMKPSDKEVLADFLWLLNLIRLRGTKDQNLELAVIINELRQIAVGTIKYNKNDLLPNIDKFLSTLPITQKDNSKDN